MFWTGGRHFLFDILSSLEWQEIYLLFRLPQLHQSRLSAWGVEYLPNGGLVFFLILLRL
ncbi:hypothetical protein LINGRAHAP2_LOCUS10375 [Linum grandiflorum]